MKRRAFLKQTGLGAVGVALASNVAEVFSAESASIPLDPNIKTDWLRRWEKNLVGDARNRYCDRELAEEIGWLVSPFLNAFYYGYLATHNTKWLDYFVDWTDSWLKRGIKEPDGYIGWPKKGGDGGSSEESYSTDSLLGEAMGFRPVVLMASQILKTPELENKYKIRAQAWIDLAGQTFEKWDSRSCWREVPEGGLWVVPEFGIDLKTGNWSNGYAKRATQGFSNPDNKQNHIARWLLAMNDVTGKKVYRDRAEKWFRLMRSRMKTREGGKYFVWNYWEPGGPWDYKPDGSTRHWVGVHPNGGYYGIDVEGIVAAYEHGLVFSRDDIQRLIATNRDFMWNKSIKGAQFQRIDGGETDSRWEKSPGVLWAALVPYDETLRNIFIENNDPVSWGGMAATPWFVAREAAGQSNKL
ncbi:MAG TPA: hypothetical protein VGO67_15535 [Verrucomicrobiae bacterium]|jgi:hypothetical protein